MKIAIILEAAGDARRFGRNKLLEVMPDGRPMISSIMEAVRSVEREYNTTDECSSSFSCFISKILVTQYDEIASMAPDFKVMTNSHPELGISRSMQLGIEAAEDADAYMFCVCDQPYLSPDTIKALVEAYLNASDTGKSAIVSLAWNGRMYNPKIFSSDYRDELMALTGDTGGRQIIAAHRDKLIPVEAVSEREIMDIDTPKDSSACGLRMT